MDRGLRNDLYRFIVTFLPDVGSKATAKNRAING